MGVRPVKNAVGIVVDARGGEGAALRVLELQDGTVELTALAASGTFPVMVVLDLDAAIAVRDELIRITEGHTS